MAGVIPPPNTRPAVLGLANASAGPDLSDVVDPARWELGYKFQPAACGGGWIEDPCNVEVRTVPERPPFVDVEPFNVVVSDACSAFGFMAEDYELRARDLLAKQRSFQVASELWTGDLATAAGWPNQFLTDSASDTVTNGPAAVVAALACLEQGLATCQPGARGMIHATPQLVTQWAALGNTVLRREGGLLLTVHDTIVVSDGGYDGSGPGGTPAGASQWAYATGIVAVNFGPVTLEPATFDEALDRSDNSVVFFASQPATYRWDGCCALAAEVDLSICLIDGVS